LAFRIGIILPTASAYVGFLNLSSVSDSHGTERDQIGRMNKSGEYSKEVRSVAAKTEIPDSKLYEAACAVNTHLPRLLGDRARQCVHSYRDSIDAR
jgi:hypothetical protein